MMRVVHGVAVSLLSMSVFLRIVLGLAVTASPASDKDDLLIAADVLIYIGDIERLMALARRALRPGGLFALTAESMEASQPGAVTDRGYHLHDHARYAHRSAYLELQARQAGLECVVMQEQALRREQQRVVPALYVLLRASDAAAPVPTAGC